MKPISGKEVEAARVALDEVLERSGVGAVNRIALDASILQLCLACMSYARSHQAVLTRRECEAEFCAEVKAREGK